jgi:hypothetical protein
MTTKPVTLTRSEEVLMDTFDKAVEVELLVLALKVRLPPMDNVGASAKTTLVIPADIADNVTEDETERSPDNDIPPMDALELDEPAVTDKEPASVQLPDILTPLMTA